ncbi:hypothetical protein QTP88_006278 [Uroleucon formosanum]
MVTTILGYGSVTPQTPWGRVITIVYALIGIPLMLLYLSTMGETLAKNFRRIYSRLCSPGNREDRDDGGGGGGRGKRAPPNTVSSNHVGGGDYYRHPYEFETVSGAAAYVDVANVGMSGGGGQKRVPVLLSLSVVAAYVALGAFIYQKLERWTLLEGSYFCFTSLGTIGFGELVPGGVESTKDVSVFVSSGYILVGMAVVAMCFQLLQDELAAMSRNCRWCCCWWWMWSQQQHQQQLQHKDINMVVCTVAGAVDGGGGCDDDDCGGAISSAAPHSQNRGRQPPHPHNRNNGVAAGGSCDGGCGGGGGGGGDEGGLPLPAPPPPFQRQSAGRCSVQQPMMGHHRTTAHYSDGVVSEYFIPRSASAHDLCSAIEMQKIPPPLPPSALRTAAATLARPPRQPATCRDKMVTFEDEKRAAFDHHQSQLQQHRRQNHHNLHDQQDQQQQHHRSSGDLIV